MSEIKVFWWPLSVHFVVICSKHPVIGHSTCVRGVEQGKEQSETVPDLQVLRWRLMLNPIQQKHIETVALMTSYGTFLFISVIILKMNMLYW